MFFSAVKIVAVIFILIAIGYVFQLKGWLGSNAQTVLSRITLRIGMPGLIFSNIMGNYTRDMLMGSLLNLLVPFVVIASMYIVSSFLVQWMNIPTGRQGVFRALFTFGNSVFVGMPVCRAMFGEGAVPVVLLYYLVNTLFWWLIGAPAVARDGGAAPRNDGGADSKNRAPSGASARKPSRLAARLASPPLITVLVSVALVLMGFDPPEIVMTTAGYLGGMVTPLSMLFIGTTLCAMLTANKDSLRNPSAAPDSSKPRRLGGIKWQKGYGAMLFGRCLLGPALCLPLCLLMGLPSGTLGVFFLQAGMPAQTQSCLWAQEHGGDAGYAAGGIALSTLAGLLAIPVYALILGAI